MPVGSADGVPVELVNYVRIFLSQGRSGSTSMAVASLASNLGRPLFRTGRSGAAEFLSVTWSGISGAWGPFRGLRWLSLEVFMDVSSCSCDSSR